MGQCYAGLSKPLQRGEVMYLEQVPAIYQALVQNREAQRAGMPFEQALAFDIGRRVGVATGPLVLQSLEQYVRSIADRLPRP